MSTTYTLDQPGCSPSVESTLPDPFDAIDGPVEVSGFRGKLDEIGFPSLLCILEMERKTGILVLTFEPSLEKASLYFSEGRVFRAHLSGRKEPRNAAVVYSLLACTDGTFDFHPSDVAFDDELQCTTTRLIVEGARRMNEAPSPAPLDFVIDKRMPGLGVDGLDMEKRVPLDSQPPSRPGNPDEAASVDRSAPTLETALEGTTSRKTEDDLKGWLGPNHRRVPSDSSRRWASAKRTVAILLMGSFVLLVLSAAISSGQGLSASPAAVSTDIRESPPPAHP